MVIALVRFVFFITLFSVPNLALADERGVAAGAVTGGVAGAIVGGPIGAIIGAGIGGAAGGAVTSPAAQQMLRGTLSAEPEAPGTDVQTTCVEDAVGNRTCQRTETSPPPSLPSSGGVLEKLKNFVGMR